MKIARPIFPLFFVVSDELKDINNEKIIKEINSDIFAYIFLKFSNK